MRCIKARTNKKTATKRHKSGITLNVVLGPTIRTEIQIQAVGIRLEEPGCHIGTALDLVEERVEVLEGPKTDYLSHLRRRGLRIRHESHGSVRTGPQSPRSFSEVIDVGNDIHDPLHLEFVLVRIPLLEPTVLPTSNSAFFHKRVQDAELVTDFPVELFVLTLVNYQRKSMDFGKSFGHEEYFANVKG